jgi:hypothetical protein
MPDAGGPLVSRDPRVTEGRWIAFVELAGLTVHPPIADVLAAWSPGQPPREIGPRWAPEPDGS